MKIKCTIAFIMAAASLVTIPAASAQDLTCDNVNFSEAVMESFAGIRNSCLEIVDRDGGPHAVLNAEVVRVRQTTVNLKFKRRDGKFTNAIQFRPEQGTRFEVEGGRSVLLKDLSASSVLRVYVPVNAPIARIIFEFNPDTGAMSYHEIYVGEE